MEWKWESPLIARIGYIEITFNLWTLIELPTMVQQYLDIRMMPVKDIYSVAIDDVQLFIEKRMNVFMNTHAAGDQEENENIKNN